MLNIRDNDLGTRTPHKTLVEWGHTSSLEQILRQEFPESAPDPWKRQTRLSPMFTMATLARVCSLNVGWTESLNDHLRLDMRRKVLWVFPYKDFLLGHLSCSQKVAANGSVSSLPRQSASKY